MAYCTVDDLKDRLDDLRLAELSNEDGSDDIDSSVVDKAIADADSLIDSYLRGRYTVPLSTPIDSAVSKASQRLTLYFLVENRALNVGIGEDFKERNYNDVVRWLRDVAGGKTSVEAAEISAGSPAGFYASASSRDRVFPDGVSGYL